MTERTLKIKLQADLGNAEQAFQQLNTAIHGTGAAVKNLTTTTVIGFDADGNAVKSYIHTLELAARRLNELKNASVKVQNLNTGIGGEQLGSTQTTNKSKNLLSEFQRQLNSRESLIKLSIEREKNLYRHGADSELTIRKEQAIQEYKLAQDLHTKLASLQEKFLSGQINLGNVKFGQDAIFKGYQNQILQLERQIQGKLSQLNQQKQIEQARIQAFNTSLAEQENRLKSSIERQKAIQINGINSIEVARIAAAEKERRLMEKLATELAAIQARVASGSISNFRGLREAAKVQQDYKNRILEANKALAEQEHAVRQAEAAHRNLFLRIAEFVGIYRFQNAVLNTTLNSLRSIPQIGIQLEATQAVLSTTAGSIEGAGLMLMKLDEEAQRTGITISALRESFRTFSASTKLAGESMDTTWRIFQNMNTVITALHLSGDQANHIFLALAQIFNKSKIQSEELVKQLGNLIPGAFASMAKAIKDPKTGLSILPSELAKQMKKGLIFAHENILAFSEQLAKDFAGSFSSASVGLNAAIGRMQTSFTHLGEAIYGTTSGPLHTFVEGLTSVTDYITKSIKETTALSVLMNGLFYAAIIGVTATVYSLVTAYRVASIAAVEAFASKQLFSAMPTFTQKLFAIKSATELAAVASTGLKSAMAFLLSPAGIVGGIVAITVAIYNMKTAYSKAGDEIERFRKERLKAEQDAERSRTKEGAVEVAIENNPKVKAIKEDLERTIQRKKEIDDALKLSNQVVNFNGLALLNRIDGTYENLVNKIKHGQEELSKATEEARIAAEVDFETAANQFKESIHADELHIKALEAQGKVKEAAIARFEKTYLSEKKANDDFIASAGKEFEKLSAELYKIDELLAQPQNKENARLIGQKVQIENNLDDLVKRYKQANDEIKDYGIARQKEIDDALSKDGKVGIKEARFDYKDINRDLNNALLSEKDYITKLDGEYKLHNISIYSYFKQRQHLIQKELEKKLTFLTQIEDKARSVGDKNQIKQVSDEKEKAILEAKNKIAELDEKRETVLVEYNNLLEETKNKYDLIFGSVQEKAFAQEAETLRKLQDERKTLLAVEKDGTEEQRKQAELTRKQLEYVAAYTSAESLLKKTQEEIDRNKLKTEAAINTINAKRQAGFITGYQAQIAINKLENTQLDLEIAKLEALKQQLSENEKNKLVVEDIIALLQDAKNKQLTNLAFDLPMSEFDQKINDFKGGFDSIFSGFDKVVNWQKESNKQGFFAPLIDGKVTQAFKELNPKLSESLDGGLNRSFQKWGGYFSGVLNLGADAAMSMTNIYTKLYGAQSDQAQRSFALYKAIAIAQVAIAGAIAVMQVWADNSLNVWAKIGFSAGVAVLAAANAAIIAGQEIPAAHGGLTNVPKEQTFLLDKGERVLSPKQNQDFTNFLKNDKLREKRQEDSSSSSSSEKEMKIRNIIVLDQRYLDDYLESSSAEKIIVGHVNRNKS